MAEPGTGKTLTFLSAMFEEAEFDCLILCPVSVRRNWDHEIEKHFNDHKDTYSVHLIDSQKAIDEASHSDKPRRILIAGIESLSAGKTYERLVNFVMDSLREQSWLCVDESHLIKNPNSTRTKRATNLSKKFLKRVCMTGTPTTGKLVDLFAQFRLIDNRIFGNRFAAFKQRYCIMGGFEGRVIVGYQNVAELFEYIDHITFKARKEDCLDLPEKVYQERYVKMPAAQKKAYNDAYQDLMIVLKDETVGIKNALEALLRLSQITSGQLLDEELPAPKIAEALKVVESCSSPCVLWSCFRMEQKRLYEALVAEYGEQYIGLINGDVSASDRDELVQRFQRRELIALVASQAAGGIGINLTAANTQVFLSNTYQATHRIQAEDRLHRVGQEHSVSVIDLITEGTVDTAIQLSLTSKKDVIDGVLRGWKK
jgi:SNF2 family DNA or RNA helicase